MFLKQCQGHQTRYELVHLKQGYSNAKFEKPRLKSVRKRAKVKVFLSNQETRQLSALKM